MQRAVGKREIRNKTIAAGESKRDERALQKVRW
jgi:hypothetical protein